MLRWSEHKELGDRKEAQEAGRGHRKQEGGHRCRKGHRKRTVHQR